MEVKESEKIETGNIKQETSPAIEESVSVEENCTDEDLNLDSIIDVSGKILDFPLIDSEQGAVEEVYMYKNEFNLIPRAVGMFKGLKTLKFFANELNLFPVEFKNVVELECLQVKLGIPGVTGLELSKLKNLKELELSRVPPRPSTFPILSEIAGLKRLSKLSVCHFSIRYLPPEIACLSNLEFLDLSFNKMRKLPNEITSLRLLISLKVANNKLIELPRLSYLQRLENLDLSNNRLTSLECLKLELMRNLHTLNLQHNRLQDCQIPSWICCNLEGNTTDPSNSETAEMDVYEGSSVEPSSKLRGLSPNNQCSAARREKGWKRRYNLQMKNRQEKSNNCKKWKVDDARNRSSPDKSMTCSTVKNSDKPSSEGLSIVADVDLDNKDIVLESDNQNGNSVKENLSALKDSADGCSCPTNDSDEMQKEVKSEILETLSEAVVVLDEGSCSEASNCVVKSKRHSDKELDNPKPTKTLRPTSEPSYLSCLYSERSFCGIRDHLPDGFYDAGRDRPFMPLDSYEKNLHVNSREVILLDRSRDEELDVILLRAQALVYHFKQMNSSVSGERDFTLDDLHIASLLALFVSDHFGGSDKSAFIQKTRKSVSGSNLKEPFVCTCDTKKATKQDADTAEDIVFLDICEKSLRSVKERRNSVIVPIGGLQFGVCRHRALLMKYLCDRMEPKLPCELIRGYLDFSPHAWNVIVIKRGDTSVRMIVDACHPHDIREESDIEYFCRYIPLSRMSPATLADDDATPNCSFPSLSACDKVWEVASTSLRQCNVGSLDAVAKVRTIEVNGVSADEVRNFELCCLGEVRMLSALKHSCIIEIFGHQISSKLSLGADGTTGGRKLQTTILMEYIKCGSLKSYLEKLSNAGEKHVSPHIALSIARDVAFALTEIHSKHIIHRDIKGENILIDLERRKRDGTPIVKICDFDRAIPLHSYLHRCCIAHVGIPPPDICVGTPRWMAPEVFRAMHMPNLYGLEVDIWSFGCVLLELLTLDVPYSGLPDSEIHNYLQMGERPRLTDELESFSQSNTKLESESDTLTFLSKLYRMCTENNPADRPPANKIYNLLLSHSSPATDSRSLGQE